MHVLKFRVIRVSKSNVKSALSENEGRANMRIKRAHTHTRTYYTPNIIFDRHEFPPPPRCWPRDAVKMFNVQTVLNKYNYILLHARFSYILYYTRIL